MNNTPTGDAGRPDGCLAQNVSRELLTLAALAAGFPILRPMPDEGCVRSGGFAINDGRRDIAWNPLTDDGDAFRLMVSMHLHLRPLSFYGPGGGTVVVGVADFKGIEVPANGDQAAATRRAIVMVAAELGRAMKEAA